MVGNQRGRVRPVASGLRLLPEFTLLVDLLAVVCVALDKSLASPKLSFQIRQGRQELYPPHRLGGGSLLKHLSDSQAPLTPSAAALVVTGDARQMPDPRQLRHQDAGGSGFSQLHSPVPP